jgi:hypothetical protein
MMVLSVEAAREPLWEPYAEYCDARAREHPELAALAGERFAATAKHWSFNERAIRTTHMGHSIVECVFVTGT